MHEKNKDDNKDTVESTRRRFLKNAAKVAVYVPPAMLAISRPSYATFAESSGVNHYGQPERYRRHHHYKRMLGRIMHWFR